jgi:hypothetical protein
MNRVDDDNANEGTNSCQFILASLAPHPSLPRSQLRRKELEESFELKKGFSTVAVFSPSGDAARSRADRKARRNDGVQASASRPAFTTEFNWRRLRKPVASQRRQALCSPTQ